MSTNEVTAAAVSPAEFYDKWLAPCDAATRNRRRELVLLAIKYEPGSADNDWRRALVAHIDSQEA